MKKVLYAILALLLTPVVLFGVLVALLYFPPFQNWAVDKVAAIASEKTGMQITVGHVDLSWPLDLVLDDFIAIAPDTTHYGVQPDTLAAVRRLTVDVQLRPLFDKRIVINRLDVEDTRLNTNGFIDAVRIKGDFHRLSLASRGIDLERQLVEANGALLENANLDILLRDSVPEDTTSTPTLWRILADSIRIQQSQLVLHLGERDTTSLAASMRSAIARGVELDLAKPSYNVGSLDWIGGNLRYSNLFQLSDADIHSGPLSMQGDSLYLPSLHVRTPESSMSVALTFPLAFTDSIRPADMQLALDASLSRSDLDPYLSSLPKDMLQLLPRYPLAVKGNLCGNLRQMTFTDLDLSWPTLADIAGSGTLYNLDTPDRLRADVDLTAQVASGNVKARAIYDGASEAYDIKASLRNIDPRRFLPRGVPLRYITADIDAHGRGFDVFSPSTVLHADARVKRLVYDRWDLSALTLHGDMERGKLVSSLKSDNGYLRGTLGLGALMKRGDFNGTLTADVSNLDLYRLGFAADPLSVGFCGHVDVNSDFRLSHAVNGLFNDLTLRDSSQTYRPADIGLLLKTRPDTTYLRAQSGDFIVKLDASGNYERLLRRLTILSDTVQAQIADRTIDQPALRRLLPNMKLHVESRQDNPIATFLKSTSDISFRDLYLDLTSSVAEGLNGKGYIHRLDIGDMRLDTIMVRVTQRNDHLSIGGMVCNNKQNPQFVFRTLVDGVLQQRGATLGVRYFDADDKLGVRLGAQIEVVDSGLSLHFVPERPTVGYKEFKLNSDNFLLLGRDNRLSAKIDLIADDGTGVKVYSENTDPTARQDITMSINRLNLAEVTAVVPYAPRLTGYLYGDYHVIQNAQGQLSVVSDMQVNDMTYEQSPLGNLSTELVYLYGDNDSHIVQAVLMKDGIEIGQLAGTYYNKNTANAIDATLTMTRLPLDIANGFIPDRLFGFEGYGDGELSVRGSLDALQVDGEIYLDSTYLVSIPYGMRLRMDNDPVRIQHSKLLLENYAVYGLNDQPLNIQGSVDFSRPDRMMIDLRMRARDYQLIGAEENPQSIAYGNAFVNLFARMQGPANNLSLRGRIDVLGSTDMSYVLRDSPLSTDNHLNELVTFTDFSDTTKVVVKRPVVNGLNMDMTVDVSKGAHIMAYLNTDHSNYIDLMGGGTLRMQYSGADGLQLRGRYTLANGEMKYSLPVIPLKTFTIRDGSYLEFTGDIMNPTLNIAATERVKASVTTGGNSRIADFDCGVKITKTLADMGLEFTLDAPSDQLLHSELQAMSVEQRGKLAVTMLTTGMYLADGNTGAFTMNNALSSFLSSEISNITGNALRTLDLSVGMDNATDASGRTHTDYSFKFAKRFMNNRLKVAIGGRVSSGNELQERNNSFFDNVSLEYRLDNTANKFVTLYYENNSYDWIDGYTRKYGGGFTWRRQLNSFWDIFRFTSTEPRPEPRPESRQESKKDSIQEPRQDSQQEPKQEK